MTDVESWSGGTEGGFAVLVHGGAGDIPPERREAAALGCHASAAAALEILRSDGSALDAVERAVRVLEDDPRFNAGTGASLTSEGLLELDASIMEGTALRAGAVCALPPFRAPISIARAVLEDGVHVLYAAHGAEAFARARGFEPVTDDSMISDRAREHLRVALETGTAQNWAGGTVGAVARDSRGRVAAATSTGGTSGKRPGRIGDTPIVGAGTYADDLAGAASATGQGEGILRVTLTASAVARLASGMGAEQAARAAMEGMAARVRMAGGIIVVDRHGRLGFARSTATMSWAAAWSGGGVVSGV